jgi:hypothetical protein
MKSAMLLKTLWAGSVVAALALTPLGASADDYSAVLSANDVNPAPLQRCVAATANDDTNAGHVCLQASNFYTDLATKKSTPIDSVCAASVAVAIIEKIAGLAGGNDTATSVANYTFTVIAKKEDCPFDVRRLARGLRKA